MSGEAESLKPREIRGVPALGDNIEGGYQPQASGAVDPGQVKPPRGDTAIVAPQKPAPKQ